MPHRSTISAPYSITHEWLKELDYGNKICSIFFDQCKAFDSVTHTSLINTLSTLNLCPYILQWIQSYLSDRSQVVAVGGELSTVKKIVSDFPQGSALGPLFTIYINE